MKKNDKISVVEINGVKAKTAHAMVQDINQEYPKVYITKPYSQMTEEIRKALEDMSIFYNGILHFGGYYGEDKVFYLYFIDHHDQNNGLRSFPTEEIIEAYYNAGCPQCINIDMNITK